MQISENSKLIIFATGGPNFNMEKFWKLENVY